MPPVLHDEEQSELESPEEINGSEEPNALHWEEQNEKQSEDAWLSVMHSTGVPACQYRTRSGAIVSTRAKRTTSRTDSDGHLRSLIRGGWRAARAGWNDFYLRSATTYRSVCEPHPRVGSSPFAGVRTFTANANSD